jgi:hypothetical protein
LVAGKYAQSRFIKGDMQRVLFKLPFGIFGTGGVVPAAAITDQSEELLVDGEDLK